MAGFVVIVLLAAGAFSGRHRIAQAVAERVAERLEDRLNAELDLGHVTWESRRVIAIDALTLRRDGLEVTCADAALTVYLRPPGERALAERIDVAACDARLVEASHNGPTTATTEPQDVSPLHRLGELARRVLRYTEAVHVAELRADGEVHGYPVEAVARRITLDDRNGDFALEVDGRLHTDLLEASATCYVNALGATCQPSAIALAPVGELPAFAPVVDEVTLDPAGALRVEGIQVNAPYAGLRDVTLSAVTLNAARDTLEIDGGTIRTTLALPELGDIGQGSDTDDDTDDTDAAEDPETPNADEAAPSIGVRFVQALLEVAEDALEASALPDEIPALPVTLTVRRIAIASADTTMVEVQRATVQPDGLLEGAFGIGDMAVSFSTNMHELDRLELTAEAVELAPLGDLMGERVETAGVFDLDAVIALSSAPRALELTGTIAVRDAALVHPGVSTERLADMEAEGRFNTRIDLDARSWTASFGLAFNGVPLDGALQVTPEDESWAVTAGFGLSETTRCAEIYDGIPAGMIPHLTHRGLRFTGAAQPRLSFEYVLQDPSTFELEAGGFPGTCEITYIDPAYDPMQLNAPEYVHHVTEGVTREDIFVGPGTESWVPLGDVPSYVPALMYLSEEIDFRTNPGISLRLINKGIRYSLEHNRYAYGGSTVSQQLVKNLFFTRIKNLSRKLEEALVVWAMEAVVSKDRIIELYMNCVEFAPDVYGIENAAQYYFGVSAAELTPAEAAYIAALKPRPSSGARHWRRGHSPANGWWPERIEELLQRLVTYGGHIPQDEVAHYAPYVVGFPTSEHPDAETYPRILRPGQAPPLLDLNPPPILVPDGWQR